MVIGLMFLYFLIISLIVVFFVGASESDEQE